MNHTDHTDHTDQTEQAKEEANFGQLSPDYVLDAVEALGYTTNGRLLALNSYENRVYQVGVEDGAPVIVKFYRPNRWTDAAILEEHQFVHQLVEQEIPVVPALIINGQSLHHYKHFRLALFNRLCIKCFGSELPQILGQYIPGATVGYQPEAVPNVGRQGAVLLHFVELLCL